MNTTSTIVEDFSYNVSNNSSLDWNVTKTNIARLLWIIGSPVIFLMGTIGNSLSIIILSRKTMRKMTSSFYLVLLAISDLLMINVGLVRYFIMACFKLDIRDLTIWGCKVHIFLVYFLGHFSSWVLVAVTVERFITVWFPLKARRICTHQNGAIGMCLLIMILLSVDVHFLWSQHLIPHKQAWICYHIVPTVFNIKVWPWVDAFLLSYGPFLCILIFNTLIINRLLKAHFERKRHLTPNAQSSDGAKMTAMTFTLLTLTFTFLILMTPISVYLTGQYLWWRQNHQRNADFEIFWAVANLLSYLNNAINFILYCVSGAKFRRELVNIFHCFIKQNNVHPSMYDPKLKKPNLYST